jgi:hypothetical protein
MRISTRFDSDGDLARILRARPVGANRNMPMTTRNDIEALAVRQLAMRALMRAPGPQLAFAHKGQSVVVSIDESPYTGFFVTVHDRGRPVRQFRARSGDYEWNAIAAIIAEIAESRLQQRRPTTSPEGVRENNRRIADELTTIVGAGPSSRISIEPSSVSVMQLFAAVSHALPSKQR